MVAKRRPEYSGSSIVVLGSFNPAIFHPDWFLRQGLMSAEQAKDATVTIVHPQVAGIKAESFVCNVTTDRFSMDSTPSDHWAPLRDLVVGTFQVLEHTPITALGLNRRMHFSVEDEETWHRIGDRLAPKTAWSEVVGGRPGLRTLEIEGKPAEVESAILRLKLQPSARLRPGVYFESNEHYELRPDSDGRTALVQAIDILRNRWEASQNNAESIASHILTWASEQPAARAGADAS